MCGLLANSFVTLLCHCCFVVDTVVIKNCSRIVLSRTTDHSLGGFCQVASISTIYKQAFPLFGSIIQLALLFDSHLALFSKLTFSHNSISTFLSTNWPCQTYTHHSQVPTGLVKNHFTLRYTRTSTRSTLTHQLARSFVLLQYSTIGLARNPLPNTN